MGYGSYYAGRAGMSGSKALWKAQSNKVQGIEVTFLPFAFSRSPPETLSTRQATRILYFSE